MKKIDLVSVVLTIIFILTSILFVISMNSCTDSITAKENDDEVDNIENSLELYSGFDSRYNHIIKSMYIVVYDSTGKHKIDWIDTDFPNSTVDYQILDNGEKFLMFIKLNIKDKLHKITYYGNAYHSALVEHEGRIMMCHDYVNEKEDYSIFVYVLESQIRCIEIISRKHKIKEQINF